MYAIVYILYFIILASFITAALFIVYHLKRYSINPSLTLAMRVIFILVFGLLILINTLVFFSVDWSQLNYYFSI